MVRGVQQAPNRLEEQHRGNRHVPLRRPGCDCLIPAPLPLPRRPSLHHHHHHAERRGKGRHQGMDGGGENEKQQGLNVFPLHHLQHRKHLRKRNDVARIQERIHQVKRRSRHRHGEQRRYQRHACPAGPAIAENMAHQLPACQQETGRNWPPAKTEAPTAAAHEKPHRSGNELRKQRQVRVEPKVFRADGEKMRVQDLLDARQIRLGVL